MMIGIIIFSFILGVLFIRWSILEHKEGKESKVIVYLLGFAGALGIATAVLVAALEFSSPKVEHSSDGLSESQMNDLGYHKKNGKWYFQGDGVN